MTTLLEFHEVSVARGDRILLRRVSGRVAAGEILHIRGANGIGKTSLLEILAGLREPEAGAVTRGFEPDGCHWIGHRNAINPALTPLENLRFWCALQGASQEPLGVGLRAFGLQGVADQPCRQLSAGQKRRTALARLAVAPRPLWFLDEPLSALDQSGITLWLSLLAKHQQGGGAAVITSHQAMPADLAGLRSMELA